VQNAVRHNRSALAAGWTSAQRPRGRAPHPGPLALRVRPAGWHRVVRPISPSRARVLAWRITAPSSPSHTWRAAGARVQRIRHPDSCKREPASASEPADQPSVELAPPRDALRW